jgi:hypothetical protein
VKVVYNVSIYTIARAAGAAIVGYAERLGGTAVGVVALVIAGLVGGLITHIAVAVVIAVAQQTSLIASWRAGAGLQLLSMVGNVAAAVVVLVLARRDPRLIAALPVVGLCLHQFYVGRLRGQEERTLAQRQLEVADAFTADLDETAVAGRAAAEIHPRPHRSLSQTPPAGRTALALPPAADEAAVLRRGRLRGLIHEYAYPQVA